MAKIKIAQVTALPVTKETNTIYMVSVSADVMEVYMTGNDSSVVKRLLNEADIQSLIDAALSGISGIEVVNTITDRDALSLTGNTQVMVLDASLDSTVDSGSATYVYRVSDTSWTKISEAESLDVVMNWDNIVGKPTSTPAQIDASVAQAHAHTNKTQLDLIGQDADGDITYNGSKVANEYITTAW